MKRVLLLIIVGICIASSGSAQQRYIGQWSLSTLGGINSLEGYYGSIQAERYGNFPSSMIIDLTYMNSRYIASERFNFNVAQYFIACRYAYSIKIARPLFFCVGVGGVLGYENPPIRTEENKILNYPSKFNVGLDLSPQVEYAITSRISLVGQARGLYLFTTSFENFLFTGGLGLKFYL